MSKTNKFNLKYFHFCDFASVTTDGKANILGVFEKIIVKNVNIEFPHIYIVFNIESQSNNDQEFILKIVDPEKKELFTQKIQGAIDIPSDKSKVNINGIVQINNLPIDLLGEYLVTLTCGEESIVKEKLLVEQLPLQNE